MKILYTKKFKETLSQPWNNISLGEIKLRRGTNTGLTKKNISGNLLDGIGLDSFTETFVTNRTYTPEIIRRSEGGIQICFEIPREDQNFYNEEEEISYQTILFFYTDLLTNSESLAFVCYGDIDSRDDDSDFIKFINLNLTSRKNIITLPKFSWVCNINFSQSEVIKFLESPVGNFEVSPYLSEIGYTSKESWKAWMIDSISDETLTPWIETTYINKYGIKIY